jgi:hypothetical protein
VHGDGGSECYGSPDLFRMEITNNSCSYQTSTMVHCFSSVAHVLVAGAKTTGPIVKKFGFLKSNFLCQWEF